MELRLSVPGKFDRLEQISRFIEQAGYEAGLDQTAVSRCQLAVDEACTNIIEHAYQGEGHGKKYSQNYPPRDPLPLRNSLSRFICHSRT